MTVTEWCSNCTHEVELERSFVAQTCPNCKETIYPCAQCISMDCGNCPLEVDNIKTKTVFSYVGSLIDNTDGRFDRLESAWLTVPKHWLERQTEKLGFKSLDEFYNTYTYDDSEHLFREAIEEGVMIGCGTGDMREGD